MFTEIPIFLPDENGTTTEGISIGENGVTKLPQGLGADIMSSIGNERISIYHRNFYHLGELGITSAKERVEVVTRQKETITSTGTSGIEIWQDQTPAEIFFFIDGVPSSRFHAGTIIYQAKKQS